MNLRFNNFKSILLSGFCSLCFVPMKAQSYKIGTVEIYGARKTNPETILFRLDIREGDSIKPLEFKSDPLAAKLKQIPGVKYATVNPVCCDTSNSFMIYVGIGENDSVILKHRPSPKTDIKLPKEMMEVFQNLSKQVEAAVRSGKNGEDDSNGYALFEYEPARKEQEKFIGFAEKNFSILANVLKNSKHADHRAAAAEIIAYGSEKEEIVNQLLYAIDDADEDVRNNSARALAILAAYSQSHPVLNIIIPAKPFIRMVNSIVWTDRNKGCWVLMQLTQKRNPEILKQIKNEAISSIIEMAKWKDRGHAFFPFIILGRIAGVDENKLIEKNYSRNWLEEVNAMIDVCCK